MTDQSSTRRLAVGALAGVVAALAMTLVQVLLRLGLGVPSPAELIGDRLGERVPVKPFPNLIGGIGSYGWLKALSVFGVLLATLVLGAVVGAVYARLTRRQQRADGPTLGGPELSRRAVIVLAVIVGAAWVVSVAAFWPLLSSYYRGAPRGTARVANAGWLLVAYAFFGASLVVAYRLLATRPAEASEDSPSVVQESTLAEVTAGGQRGLGYSYAEAAAAGLVARVLAPTGEYGYNVGYFGRMIGADAVDVLQADATRCGVTGLLQVAALCQARSMPLSAHTARALHAHVCCALAPIRRFEWFHDHVRIERMLFDGVLEPVDGRLVPDRSNPGHGLTFKWADAQRWAA